MLKLKCMAYRKVKCAVGCIIFAVHCPNSLREKVIIQSASAGSDAAETSS